MVFNDGISSSRKLRGTAKNQSLFVHVSVIFSLPNSSRLWIKEMQEGGGHGACAVQAV